MAISGSNQTPSLEQALANQAKKTATEVIWEPQAGSQVAFLTCPYEEVLYEGTRGPGKTDALIMDFAQFCGLGFGAAWRGILFRETFPQLSDVIAKSQKWFKQIFPKATYNKGNHSWTWPDGECLIFSFMSDPDDYWNYHGHEYPWIGWEELTNWPNLECYDAMKSCNRSSHTDSSMPRHIRATANPFGIGHSAVKSRFIDVARPKQKIVETYTHPTTGEPIQIRRCYIHGHWSENKRLVTADPLYIATLQSIKDENKRKAWLDGSWDIVAGSILGAFWHQQTHWIKPFKIPKGWRTDRSFDWGSTKPFSVGWWAESNGEQAEVSVLTETSPGVLQYVPQTKTYPPGTKFRIAEWYGCKPNQPNTGLEMLAADIAHGIRDREAKMLESGLISSPVKPGPADSSIFDTQDGHCIAVEMSKAPNWIKWIKADKSPGSRINGWERLRDMLAASLEVVDGVVGGPRKSPMEKPGLFIFNTCLDWKRCVPVLPRDPHKMDDVDTAAEDHNGDETRYEIYRKKIISSSEELEL